MADDRTISDDVVVRLRPDQARPRDPTGAERQARFREQRKRNGKKKGKQKYKDGARTVTRTPPSTVTLADARPNASAVTRSDVEIVTVPVVPDTGARTPAQRHGRGIRFAALTAALALATVSGGFSITGMTSIFVGAYWPVVGMGVALEVGKLSAVAWLGHQRGTASWRLRAALAVLVAVLMGLNAVGCYGFLAKAHIGHQVEGDVAVAGRAADIEGRISVQADLVADLDRRIGQIDGAVQKSTSKGRTNAAMQLAADQKRNRADLVTERVRQGKMLAD